MTSCGSRWNGKSHFVVENFTGWISTKSIATGGVRLVEANTNGKRPTGSGGADRCERP